MKKRIGLSSLLVGLVLSVCAQTDSIRITSIEVIRRHNYWLAGENPVALSYNSFRNFSIATAGYEHTGGNFGVVTDPAAVHLYSAGSESFRQLGAVSLYGKLDYTQSHLRDISWNGMTGSDWQAVNLCDSVAGNQRSEQYRLAGALSVPLHARWVVGGGFGFKARLTAKDTDPRHKNQWMELLLTPGIGYRHEKFRLGASLRYKKSKEEVDYRNVGTHITYPFFVAYPLDFTQTIPQGEALTWYYSAKEVGGGLQLDLTTGALQLFQQISAGVMGQEVLSNRILNRSEGETDVWRAAYTGKLGWGRRPYRHEISLQAGFREAKSYDNLQRQGSNGFWDSYGRVARSEYRVADCGLTYGFYRQRDAWNQLYSVLVGVGYEQEERVVLFYPLVYSQPVRRFTLHVTVARQWVLPGGVLDLSVGGGCGVGGGTLLKEKTQDGQTAPQIPLWQNHELLQQAFAYQTAFRWNLTPSVRYTRFIPASPLAWFIGLSGQYERSDQSMEAPGKSHVSGSLGLIF